MPLNSVNTNMGAMVALQSLNATNTQLQATQKKISTGYRVADATDDGAAYAIAQGVRSDVSALTSANQQLQNTKGLVSTTVSGLNNVSKTMDTMKTILEKLGDSTISSTTRTQYQAQVKEYLGEIKTFFTNSGYNGRTLVGDLTGSIGQFAAVKVTQNEQGDTYSIASTSGSGIYAAITALGGASQTSTQIVAAMTATGSFTKQFTAVSTALNTYGNASRYIDAQVSFNNDRVDAMNSGLGALIDADLSKEAANLQALQTRQQLGTQALSLANQAPNSLLSLFK